MFAVIVSAITIYAASTAYATNTMVTINTTVNSTNVTIASQDSSMKILNTVRVNQTDLQHPMSKIPISAGKYIVEMIKELNQEHLDMIYTPFVIRFSTHVLQIE